MDLTPSPTNPDWRQDNLPTTNPTNLNISLILPADPAIKQDQQQG
jgi:hypothetical protein